MQTTETTPWVTVIVLAYKQRPFVQACLESLEKQGLDGIQIILIDNGSGDGTADIFQRWVHVHPHAELEVLPHNMGHCEAFNRGLNRVRAPYVTDLSADDVLYPNSLRTRVEALQENPEAVFVHSNVVYLSENGEPLGLEHPADIVEAAWLGRVWQGLFEHRFIASPSVLFRTDALRTAEGYDASLSFEDFDIWMRLARKGQIAYTSAITVGYRQHQASASQGQTGRRTQSFLESVLIVCQKAYQMAESDSERNAIGRFARYHLRLAAYAGHPVWVRRYSVWLEEHSLKRPPFLWIWLLITRLPLKGLYNYYTRRLRLKKLFPL